MLQCRPYYLPREFTCVTIVAVYCPPTSVTKDARDKLITIIDNVEKTHPDAVLLVGGDFNQLYLNLKSYEQMITCATRAKNILDKLYCNIPRAYICKNLPPIGLSDHNVVCLLPRYVQKCRRIKPVSVSRPVWSCEACENLISSLEITDWSVFHNDSVNAFVESITGYINFCVSTCVPTKRFTCYSNTKPWISRDVVEAIK